jgi:hypothetical protein
MGRKPARGAAAAPPDIPFDPLSAARSIRRHLRGEDTRDAEGLLRVDLAHRIMEDLQRQVCPAFHAWTSGAHRIVVKHASGWVLKVPFTDEGRDHAAHEWEKLSQVAPENRAFFPEMYDLGAGAALSRFYPILTRAEFSAHLPRIASLAFHEQLRDIAPWNMGSAGAGFVFTDFGESPLLSRDTFAAGALSPSLEVEDPFEYVAYSLASAAYLPTAEATQPAIARRR